MLDEAKAIIAKYANYCEKTGFLFPILDCRVYKTPMQKFNRVRKLCHQINKELHKLTDE